MTRSSGRAPSNPAVRSRILTAVRRVPGGRVATREAVATEANAPVEQVVHILTNLPESDREVLPWHRIVAKGGAIGWHSHRDAQFAQLVREGIMVSPAGIVQDMNRVALFELSEEAVEAALKAPGPGPAAGRSRGYKDRP